MNKFITVLSVFAVLGFIACESSVSKKMVDSDTTDTIDTTDSSISETDSINGSDSDTDSNTENNKSTDSSIGDTDSENNNDTADTSDTSMGSDSGVGFIDQDSDGYSSFFDCNDSDPNIYPGAPEPAEPNGVDEDCNDSDGYTIDTDTGGDPNTCQEAKDNRTYMGCDFWPTITYNMVWYNPAASTGFEFAVVVANDQSSSVTVEITGGGLSSKLTETIPAGDMKAIKLPWVQELKGTTFTKANTSGDRVTKSVRKDGGAYHMTATAPVTTWQFSPLDFDLGITPVPAGCIDTQSSPGHCLSVTNDASLLLPSTAMTGAYRAVTLVGDLPGDVWGSAAGAIAITATQDNTLVKVKLSGRIAGGTGITSHNAGKTVEYNMNAGDVVQLLGKYPATDDLSGSVIIAEDALNTDTDTIVYKPVQVIGLSPIAYLGQTADHIEETVLPAEVLGHKYIIAPPTGAGGFGVNQIVKLVGNVNGTTLSYSGVIPSGAPVNLAAGQSVTIETTNAFIVESQDSDHPFLAVSFMKGAEPSTSMIVAPEQFRESYSFLAPLSYTSNYCDVLIPDGATVTLDGAAIGGYSTSIGTTGWSVRRVALTAGPGSDGKHKLISDKPVGLQVMGHGDHVSYYYPGGMKLDVISDPPLILE